MDADSELSHVDHEIWGDDIEDKFINMMYVDTLSGSLRAGKITARDHANYVARLTSLGFKMYDVTQVKGKIHRLKQMQRLFTGLMHQIGMGWDPDTKMVLGSDQHWANAIRANQKLKKFRTFGCPRYAKLRTIFGASVAMGTLHHASTEPPPDLDNEAHLDAEMRRRGQSLGIQSGGDLIHDGLMQFSMDMGQPSSCSSRRRQKERAIDKTDEEISKMCAAITCSYEASRKSYESRGEASGEK
ncbi:uncharacterized protein LOC122310368 [Carya illinoinensis]|uniref:Myb/SANT-like domain-containing protein n=1 Tax=Carya illinoinensis TaxID=32201 RepID=A0A8T1QLC3_CARIL|nr:uncharacterized protein LOC122310368 [Carya illinoinensis]KAG6655558.1 hypothetical protein CIPAW_05G225500 [Carya illinoinensis]